jgi:polyhydroxybutyrate depolymerase
MAMSVLKPNIGDLIAVVFAVLTVLSHPTHAAEDGGSNARAVLAPGEHSFTLKHDGAERSYLVHMPPQAAGGKPLPVVLNFHGAGSNGKQEEGFSNMNPCADRHGFIAVYPNGSGNFDNHFTWNAGFCCTYAMTHQIDDVGFVIAVIDDLAPRTPINRRRVYATGMSNGAMLAYRLGAQASNYIAAIAPVAGSMVTRDFRPEHPMPLMAFNSVNDPFVRYEGGAGKTVLWLFRRGGGRPSIEQVIAKWRQYDRCPEAPDPARTLSGAPASRNAGITATRYAWGPCANDTEVVLWKFTGSGHVWPGGIQDRFEHVLGRTTDLIDANEEMWQFFSKFELPKQ